MSAPRDVEREFEELDPQHGGNDDPLVTDSRPQFFYIGHDWDCRVEIIAPGPRDSRIGVHAYVAFLSPADHFGRLHQGSSFLFRHGQRTVGFGTVTRLLDLEHSARRQRADPNYHSWHQDVSSRRDR